MISKIEKEESLELRDVQIAANLTGEKIDDFGMARD